MAKQKKEQGLQSWVDWRPQDSSWKEKMSVKFLNHIQSNKPLAQSVDDHIPEIFE